MRWAVLAVPSEPDEAGELDAGAATDWAAGAAGVSADPPQASMVAATSDVTASAAVRIPDSEFITFLPRSFKFAIACGLLRRQRAAGLVAPVGDTMPTL